MYNTIGRWQFVSSMEVVRFLECPFPLYIDVCMHVYWCMARVSVCVQLLSAARGQPDGCQTDPHSAALPPQ